MTARAAGAVSMCLLFLFTSARASADRSPFGCTFFVSQETGRIQLDELGTNIYDVTGPVSTVHLQLTRPREWNRFAHLANHRMPIPRAIAVELGNRYVFEMTGVRVKGYTFTPLPPPNGRANIELSVRTWHAVDAKTYGPFPTWLAHACD